MRVTNRYGYRNKMAQYYPADSVSSPFIPIHAVRNGVFIKKGDQKVLLYNLEIDTNYNKVGMVSKIIGAMESNSNYPRYFEKHIGFLYYADKGQLVDMTDRLNPKVLVQLCVKKEYLFTLKSEVVQEHKLALIVSKFLQTHKIAKTVENNYIQAQADNLDIIYTNNVYNLCYHGRIEAPKAATFPQYMEQCNYMNQLLTNAYAK